MKIPSEIVAGDSLSWIDRAFIDELNVSYNSDKYTLIYVIRGANSLTLTAVGSDSGWKTSLTSVQSASLAPGLYQWQAFVKNSTTRKTAGSGTLTILKDLTNEDDGIETRSQNQIDLENVEDAIRSLIAGGAIKQYKIMNREVWKMDLGELLNLKAHLRVQVNREKRKDSIKNGQGDPFAMYVRF